MSYLEAEENLSLMMIKERVVFEKALKSIGIKRSSPFYVKRLKDFTKDQRNHLLKVLEDFGASAEFTETAEKFFNFFPPIQPKLSNSKKKSHFKKPKESYLFSEYGRNKIKEARIEIFPEQFNNLKNELIKKYFDFKNQDFNFEDNEAIEFYENHISNFDIGIDFSNAGLVAFTTYNACNAQRRPNKYLWKDAMLFVANLSESINKESGFIEKLKVEESRSILINYMDHGNKLARNEDANLRTYEDLKTNRGESQAIGILNTVSDLTNKVSKLENPTIEGLCDYLYDLALQAHKEGAKNVWSKAVDEMTQIKGHGLALASNFIKDLLLLRWNLKGKSFGDLHQDFLGYANKPDVHVKRMLCLITQPWLFDFFNENQINYDGFRENDADEILNKLGKGLSWEENYYELVNIFCEEARILPLELDRVLYGLMSGNISDFGKGIEVLSPTINELEKLLKINSI